MAYTLPSFEIDDLPMHLDALGRPQFCRVNDEAFFATFHLGIQADADGEWEITSIHMGTQELKGDIYRRFAQHFEAEHAGKIHDHVSDNYAAAVEGARLGYDRTRLRTLKHELEVAALAKAEGRP
jgi:hypothetical protein